jgi:hypothetical protein
VSVAQHSVDGDPRCHCPGGEQIHRLRWDDTELGRIRARNRTAELRAATGVAEELYGAQFDFIRLMHYNISTQKKSELESEARRAGTSLAQLLELITADWLQEQRKARNGDEKEQAAIRRRVMAAVGTIRGGDPTRSQRASDLVREDFADATLVHLAARASLSLILTIDHDDFETYRIGGRKKFTILPARGAG